MQPVYAILSNGMIIVPTQRDVDSLSQDGYGSHSKSGNLILAPVEALYLVEKERVEVTDERTRVNMSFEGLFIQYSNSDEFLWNKYLIYKDLRVRGFVVKGAEGLRIEFKVYERGGYMKDNPAYYLHAVYEGKDETVGNLCEVLNGLSPGVTLKIAVIDRRGEIVYYSLSDLDFGSLGSEDGY